MARVYLQVQFRPWDKRAYTYHCDDDGPPFVAGDSVRVPTKGEGEQVVTVVRSFTEPAPTFETKAINGRGHGPRETLL